MNKAYKVIWSTARNCYIVVSELAKRHTKAPTISGVKAVVASVTAAAVLSLMLGGYGVAWADVGDNTNTFKNFANGDLLKTKSNNLILDKEFSNSTGLYPINAHSAYTLGYSGKGIILGVREAPEEKSKGIYGYFIDPRHSEFKDKVKFEESVKTTNDLSNHATHVGGIIAAKKDGDDVLNNMHGVAYDASLYSYSVQFTGNVDDNIVAINESFAVTDQQGRESQKEITHNYIEQGKVVVHTMGNDALVEGELGIGNNNAIVNYNNENDRNSYISVVGFNPHVSSDDSAFLLLCTSLSKNEKSTTVTAPGQSINSTLPNNKYSGEVLSWSGTSMAAPYVTGAIGLVKEAFPYMNNKQLSDIVLSTANNSFKISPFYCNIQRKKNESKNNFILTKLRIIIVNDKNTENPDKTQISEAIHSIYNQYFVGVKYENFNNYEDFANYVSGTEGVLDSAFLTREEIFGQGLLDAGKAVQGIGAIDTNRLDTSDKSSKYSNYTYYLYPVDTKDTEDNFNKRSYSIWSNDIEERLKLDGIHAGIIKEGKVDLVLLGDNTGDKGYQGPNVVTDGKLQIVRGVKGDVYAVGYGTAEINGAAKSVYAIDGGKVVIKDTDVNKLDTISNQPSQELDAESTAQVVADATAAALNKSWYEEALPEKTAVDIKGGLFAVDTEGEGTTIDVTLKQKGSQIKGALYQDELSKINLDLSKEAKLIVEQGKGYYDGNTYTGNNTIENLSLNSKATVDLKTDKSFQTLTVNNLYGSNGIFALNTDIKNNQGDKLVVNNAPLNSLQNLQIWDENFGIEKQENTLLVATSPSSVIFSGLSVDEGVYNYFPILSRTITGGNAEWFFSGYDTSVTPDSPYTTWVDKYTTKDKINTAIASTTNRIVDIEKVDGGDAFEINKRMGDTDSVISGNVNFQNQGPVKINLYNLSDGAGIVGIDTTNGNFTAEQPFTIDSKINANSSHVKVIDNKQNAIFNSDLSINLECYGGFSYNDTTAIHNEGHLEVLGNTYLSFSESNSGDKPAEPNYGIYNEGTIKLKGDSVDVSSYLTPKGSASIYNTGEITINSGDVKLSGGINNTGKIIINGDDVKNLSRETNNTGDITITAKNVDTTGDIKGEGKIVINANNVVFGEA